MATRSSDYSQVPGSPEEASLSSSEDVVDEKASNQLQPRPVYELTTLTYGIYFACLVCCFVNIFVLLREYTNGPIIVDPKGLQRPSQYVDFDAISWTQSRLDALPKIHNFPVIVAQVSTSEPGKVFPIDPARWIGQNGTQSPEVREVLITPDVSTIVQFRVLDYGMERCSVAIEIPSEQDVRQRYRDNSLDLDGDTTVEVWQLETEKELDVRLLSKRTVPPRKSLVGKIHAEMGQRSGTVDFPCKSRSLYSFELACPSHDCRIQFTQDGDKPIFAFYLLQKSSL